jgi:hypothetical protein
LPPPRRPLSAEQENPLRLIARRQYFFGGAIEIEPLPEGFDGISKKAELSAIFLASF